MTTLDIDTDTEESEDDHNHDACLDKTLKFRTLGVVGLTSPDRRFYASLAEDLSVDASFVAVMDVCRYAKFIQMWLAKAGTGKNSVQGCFG